MFSSGKTKHKNIYETQDNNVHQMQEIENDAALKYYVATQRSSYSNFIIFPMSAYVHIKLR